MRGFILAIAFLFFASVTYAQLFDALSESEWSIPYTQQLRFSASAPCGNLGSKALAVTDVPGNYIISNARVRASSQSGGPDIITGKDQMRFNYAYPVVREGRTFGVLQVNGRDVGLDGMCSVHFEIDFTVPTTTTTIPRPYCPQIQCFQDACPNNHVPDFNGCVSCASPCGTTTTTPLITSSCPSGICGLQCQYGYADNCGCVCNAPPFKKADPTLLLVGVISVVAATGFIIFLRRLF